MLRELSIHLYLIVFRFIFNIFKQYPQKKKTVAVASFGDNIMYTARSLKSLTNEEIIVLKDTKCKLEFDEYVDDVFSINIKKPFEFLKSIYHLATATTILIDNYQGFLAVTDFRSGTTCIQLWHAAGAIKRFGLEDPTNEVRNEQAISRFKQVYDRFDYTIVGSEKMSDTFQNSFGLTPDRILRTGIPRTDILFDKEAKQEMFHYIKYNYPTINDRKIILYAPTFRKDQLTNYHLELDIEQLYQKLSDDYVLFIKLHPAVSNAVNFEAYEDFVYDVSRYTETNRLLLVTDLLITDYSSIPFEYALLDKPMIFFAYDLEEYKITSGLIENYESEMPGPVVSTTAEIIQVIQQKNTIDLNEVRAFAKNWSEYSNGNASINVAKFIAKIEEEQRKDVLV